MDQFLYPMNNNMFCSVFRVRFIPLCSCTASLMMLRKSGVGCWVSCTHRLVSNLRKRLTFSVCSFTPCCTSISSCCSAALPLISMSNFFDNSSHSSRRGFLGDLSSMRGFLGGLSSMRGFLGDLSVFQHLGSKLSQEYHNPCISYSTT